MRGGEDKGEREEEKGERERGKGKGREGRERERGENECNTIRLVNIISISTVPRDIQRLSSNKT